MNSTVLLLGAGSVSASFVRFFLECVDADLVVADLSAERARRVCEGRLRAEAIALDAARSGPLEKLLRDANPSLVVSLLPPSLDPLVARACIDSARSMVTTSYVSQDLKALDGDARKRGVTILAEVGLDPGIDHLISARAVDDARQRRAEIVSYESVCGAIPAPEASLNPFSYKFSWFPRGALAAVKRPSRFLRDGRVITLSGAAVLDHSFLREVHPLGWFEDYPNMDALPYARQYGIEEARTVYRGTLRYPGWCETLAVLSRVGLLNDTQTYSTSEFTYRSLLAQLLGASVGDDLEATVAAMSGIRQESTVMQRLNWLGLFDKEPIPLSQGTPFDVLLALMLEKLRYREGERDMVMLEVHTLERHAGRHALATSQVLAFGRPEEDSAISRTVGAPAAIAANLLLEGRTPLRGVQLPIHKSIYDPILVALGDMGITVTQRLSHPPNAGKEITRPKGGAQRP